MVTTAVVAAVVRLTAIQVVVETRVAAVRGVAAQAALRDVAVVVEVAIDARKKLFFVFHNKKHVVLQQHQTTVIIKQVAFAGFAGKTMGMVFEAKTHLHQFFLANTVFFLREQVFQDPPVLAQAIVDVAHRIVGISVQAVIEGAPALVGAEFFIAPSLELRSTFLTGNYSRHW